MSRAMSTTCCDRIRHTSRSPGLRLLAATLTVSTSRASLQLHFWIRLKLHFEDPSRQLSTTSFSRTERVASVSP